MNRAEALDHVKHLVCADRQDAHGSPEQTHTIIAEMWQSYLSARFGPIFELTAQDAAVMMVIFKCARQAMNPNHFDNMIDAVGYSAIAVELGDGK